MIWRPLLQLKDQQITQTNALNFDNFNSLIKATLSNCKMNDSLKINIMDHVGLSNDAKSGMFNAINQVSEPILGNIIRCVCKNIHELWKILGLK